MFPLPVTGTPATVIRSRQSAVIGACFRFKQNRQCEGSYRLASVAEWFKAWRDMRTVVCSDQILFTIFNVFICNEEN